MSIYTHARLIGYVIPTALVVGAGRVISGWDPGGECAAIADMDDGIKAVANTDAKNRLRRFASVANLAVNSYDAAMAAMPFANRDNPVSTLRVFIAPEFYFRPAQSSTITGHSYTAKTYDEMLKALEKMFQAQRFQNWYFVCGTILSSESTSKRTIVHNRAVCIKGMTKYKQITEKLEASNIDGIPDDARPYVPDPRVTGAKTPPSKSSPMSRINSQMGIGLEICLEHGQEVLRKAKSSYSTEPTIGLHLLTAGGMNIIDTSVAAAVNGYICKNDGLFQAGMVPVEVFQVINYNQHAAGVPAVLGAAQLGIANTAMLAGNQTIALPANAGPFLAGAAYQQRIIIYDRVAMI